MDPTYLWLLAGAFLVALEAMTVPGIGIFLGGLGAMATGIMLGSGIIELGNVVFQCISFFAFTSMFAFILWKPLKKLRTAPKEGKREFRDMIGATAIVACNGLKYGEKGQVTWSGTIMNAELDSEVIGDFLPVGTAVVITSVTGLP